MICKIKKKMFCLCMLCCHYQVHSLHGPRIGLFLIRSPRRPFTTAMYVPWMKPIQFFNPIHGQRTSLSGRFYRREGKHKPIVQCKINEWTTCRSLNQAKLLKCFRNEFAVLSKSEWSYQFQIVILFALRMWCAHCAGSACSVCCVACTHTGLVLCGVVCTHFPCCSWCSVSTLTLFFMV